MWLRERVWLRFLVEGRPVVGGAAAGDTPKGQGVGDVKTPVLAPAVGGADVARGVKPWNDPAACIEHLGLFVVPGTPVGPADQGSPEKAIERRGSQGSQGGRVSMERRVVTSGAVRIVRGDRLGQRCRVYGQLLAEVLDGVGLADPSFGDFVAVIRTPSVAFEEEVPTDWKGV